MKNVLNKKYIAMFFFMLPIILVGGSVVGSKHDLSVSNFYGGSSSGASDRICVFCHTPHSANNELLASGDSTQAPIWNRRVTDIGAFTLYDDSPGSPSSVSLACLSCHDGVSSMGRVSAVGVADVHNVINASGSGLGGEDPSCGACHPFARGDSGTYPSTTWQIGADLTDDHPISINYAASFAHKPGEFHSEPINGVKLFGGKVECASCHNVHDNDNGLFLRTSNVSSGLCKSCHIK